MTTSKHFPNIETFLSQHYGVEGFPLGYVVQHSFAAAHWSEELALHCMSTCVTLKFFNFHETDFYYFKFADIVLYEDTVHLISTDKCIQNQCETDGCSHHRRMIFKRDDELCLPWPELLLSVLLGTYNSSLRAARVSRVDGKVILPAWVSSLD